MKTRGELEIEQETLAELKALFAKGAAFLMQMEVGAPYSSHKHPLP